MTAQLLLEGQAPTRLTADQYLLGRGEDCDILLPEANTLASRRHARLDREASGWYVSDLKSRNGTTLNGQRLTERTRLKNGDRIGIGGSVFTLLVPQAQPTIAASPEELHALQSPALQPQPSPGKPPSPPIPSVRPAEVPAVPNPFLMPDPAPAANPGFERTRADHNQPPAPKPAHPQSYGALYVPPASYATPPVHFNPSPVHYLPVQQAPAPVHYQPPPPPPAPYYPPNYAPNYAPQGAPYGMVAAGTCPACATMVAAGSQWCGICRSNVFNPSLGKLASPGQRLGAGLIDSVLGSLVYLGVFIPVLGWIVIIAYSVWCWMMIFQGRSPGKKLMGTIVIKQNGEPAGFGAMICRQFLAAAFSVPIFLMGFIWILIDRDKQAWHDKLMGTYVVECHPAAK